MAVNALADLRSATRQYWLPNSLTTLGLSQTRHTETVVRRRAHWWAFCRNRPPQRRFTMSVIKLHESSQIPRRKASMFRRIPRFSELSFQKKKVIQRIGPFEWGLQLQTTTQLLPLHWRVRSNAAQIEIQILEACTKKGCSSTMCL